MISEKTLSICIAKIRLMRHAPSDPAVLAELAAELNEMCNGDEEALKLVTHITRRCPEWCGLAKIRDVLFDLRPVVEYDDN
jgi:hypothetical protein